MHVKYLIVGAGPTGLGAAWRLKELGEHDFLVLEANSYAGGLSASFQDENGFTWDIGGHVLFSHYPYFDAVLNALMGSEFLEHRRIARIRTNQTWVPYPFQNNMRYLPENVQWDCVQGLLPGARPEGLPQNFKDWIYTVFGDGLARHFMLPYNFKVWAFPPELMSYQWIGERVSVVDLAGVLKNLILKDDNVTWGPNSTFRFPLRGGTGEMFRRMAARLGDALRLSTGLASLDTAGHLAVTSQGEKITYDHLLSTAPLDLLLKNIIKNVPQNILSAAAKLKHNGVQVAGIGVNETVPDDTCWMYFPENNAPFYRVTNLHNYSPNNVTPPGSKRALMAEVSFSAHKQEDYAKLAPSVVEGLKNTSLLSADKKEDELTAWTFKADYAYPVPTSGRDAALQTIQPYLKNLDIYSRGRFGAWRYEVGNMDHSFMQGVEWADFILQGKPEITWAKPN